MTSDSARTPRIGPPLLFRLARGMARRGIPGGYRLIEWMERGGMLNHLAWYPLSDRVSVLMPLWRRPNQLNLTEARLYERALVEAVAREVEAFARQGTLVDCGADVGLLSALLIARTRLIDEVIACEPNEESFALLDQSVRAWPVRGKAFCKAIADFTGRGALAQPDYDASPHASYLSAKGTSVEVIRVDDLDLNVADRTLVLKIDVEGGEAAVVRGALETLARAEKWIVTIEAHRQVTTRTGVDPFEVVKLLPREQLGRVFLAEAPARTLDLNRPYFTQVTNLPIGNLVCVSR